MRGLADQSDSHRGTKKQHNSSSVMLCQCVDTGMQRKKAAARRIKKHYRAHVCYTQIILPSWWCLVITLIYTELQFVLKICVSAHSAFCSSSLLNSHTWLHATLHDCWGTGRNNRNATKYISPVIIQLHIFQSMLVLIYLLPQLLFVKAVLQCFGISWIMSHSPLPHYGRLFRTDASAVPAAIYSDSWLIQIKLGLPDKSNFHHHCDMNMWDKHITKDCLTRDEYEKTFSFFYTRHACTLSMLTFSLSGGALDTREIRWSPS